MNASLLTLLFGLWVSAPNADSALQAALDAEAKGEHARAAALYQWAAAQDAQLSSFLRHRALRASLAAEGVAPAQVDALARTAVQWGYVGSAMSAVHADARANDGMPTPALLRAALQTPDRDAVCLDLTARLTDRLANNVRVAPEHVDIHHAECSDVEVASFAERVGHKPTPQARLRRADRLYGQVRFIATAEELEQLGDFARLEPESLRCEAYFRKGRTMHRLRKRRAESEPAFAHVADKCLAKSERALRRRALYAVGSRRYDLGDFAAAKTRFETLLAEYGDTSHADDAVFYLARVARAQGDRAREEELLALAAREYADGDMFGEIVWEVLESHYREGRYAEFVRAVDAVPRPERDGMYYSQGRLEYFAGQALLRLQQDDAAKARWRTAWEKYPWSFYGYLSRTRLAAAGESPGAPEIDKAAVPPWLLSRTWHLGPLGRLAAHGMPLAAEYAPAYEPRSDEQRWQLAHVYDEAGRYEVSHNIVRRSIDGRPWGEPAEARHRQWSIAWPDPFGELVEDAVRAEAEQGGDLVRPALARAIMREESSFIEDIESYAGALGLMQLMPRTALAHDDDVDGPATPERLKTAKVNIRVGADHIFWLARRWQGHPVLMVAAYNAGSGAVGKWLKAYPSDDIALFIEDIPALQTRDYTKRVIGSYAAYQWLTAPEAGLDDRVGAPAP